MQNNHKPYQKILIGIDFSNNTPALLTKAKELAFSSDDIHLIHVVFPIDSISNFAPLGALSSPVENMQQELIEHAKAQLENLAHKHQIPSDNLHIINGKSASEIKAIAKKIDADLVLLGKHEGLSFLLGPTISGLLHNNTVDVLVVGKH